MAKLPRAKVDVLGVGVHPLTLAETVDVIGGWIESGRSSLASAARASAGSESTQACQVITLNPEMLYRAQHDRALREQLNRGELVVPDGHGIVWAGEQLGRRFPERVAGIDLILLLAARAERAGWRLYLLGGAPGVAEAAARSLCQKHPRLLVAGTGHGYFTDQELPAILSAIRAAEPDLLLVGMGFPKQEYFIWDHRRQLGSLVALGVGGSFDVLSGRLRRSPAWVRRFRLEWLFRAWQEPARWRRLLVLPRFISLVLSARWEHRTGSGSRE